MYDDQVNRGPSDTISLADQDAENPRHSGPWVLLAMLACVVFGLALILNVHPVGDGLWFWYATAIRNHQHLYSDLHLNQQPLFVLLTAAFQSIFGLSWLAFKIFPALQLVAYCVGLALVSGFIPWRGWQRGLLILAAFGMTITTPFYRFDDYHITTQCFQVFALYLLLLLSRKGAASALPIAAGLGVLCGLATSNRLNDGAGLGVACGLALLVLARPHRVTTVLLLSACTALTLLGVVALTGDTSPIWWSETVTHASRIKGGTGGILLLPLVFPFRVAKAALQVKGLALIALVLAGFVLFARYPFALQKGSRLRTVPDWLLAGYLLLVLAFFFWQGTHNLANAKLGQFGVLLVIVTGAWVHVWILRDLAAPLQGERRPLQVLLLVPFWALLAAAMTAGIHLPDYESPVALLLLLLPIAMPRPLAAAWLRRGWLAVAAMIVAAALPAKVLVPYDWHHYHSDRLFKDRVWYRHPVYGPMLIERAQLQFMLPLCAAVQHSPSPDQLLSLPYPYPNYFCSVAPWHGYVQTWYDTSSREQIEGLAQQLATAPPLWVAYQRGLDTLSLHEASYNGGRALAQRDLDGKMMDLVAAGRWTIVQRLCFGGSDWILLRSTPPGTGEHQPQAADRIDQSEACSATESDWHHRHF